MKKQLAIMFIMSLFFAQCTSNKAGVISVMEFDQALQKDSNAVLLDLRTSEEIASGHIEGAIQLDFHDPEFQNKLEALDRDKSYYVYCRTGGRSGRTATLMDELGFKKVYDLEGGITAWKANNMPVTMPN